jgi:4-carboxymuconolactone decarboxylase
VSSLPMRMPPLAREAMTDAQRAAADELIAGPRKGVKGPFIALLRSPELMARLQKVGEYLRFGSSLPARLNEFATLIVARDWTQQFEWSVHVPLAIKEGVSQATIDALREGRRPATMAADEAIVHDFVVELLSRRGASDATYQACAERFGEQGVIELVSLVGYFTLISMALNVARIPQEPNPSVPPLPPLPR